MTRRFPPATSSVRLRTRFCFAPFSSSPSTRSTGSDPSFTNIRSGTLPASLTSVTRAEPAFIASSRVRYPRSPGGFPMRGKTVRFRWVTAVRW